VIRGKELVKRLVSPGSDLVVTPLIDAERQIGEASLDIRLGPDIIVGKRSTGAIAFDAADAQGFRDALEERQQYVRRGFGESFHLQPGEFVIARSLEYLSLPADVSAEALGRSSLGRLGLVIATATMIQPGFKGTVTLELTNVGNTPLVLEIGLPIAQLVFRRGPDGEQRDSKRQPSRRPGRSQRLAGKWWALRSEDPSRYEGQVKPAVSRLDQEEDLQWLPTIAAKYIIGVVGDRFAGKSTAINFLVGRRQFRHYRLSQFVYEEAQRLGVDTSIKSNLRLVGEEMRASHGEDVLARLAFFRIRQEFLDPEHRKSPTPIVVEGFRTAAEIETWQSIECYRTLVLTAPRKERLARAKRAKMFTSEEVEKPIPRKKAEAQEWFRERIDGKVEASGMLEQARGNQLTVEIENQNGILELQDQLSLKVRQLDRWWRSSLL
jgi:dCTP deaminase